MPRRELLYLDASAMHCYAWKQGHLRLIERFAATEAGVGGFARHVQRRRKHLFSLLVDLMEEGFQHEVLPHVRGPDRTAMLKRKSEQAFFGSPMATAISLGRERGGRRDERFLLVALTRQALIDPWLDVLRAAQAPLCGVYSPPLLLDSLIQRTTPDQPRCLLVSFTPGGMRQTFFESGRLRFSRLAQSLDDIPIGLEEQCAAEILKTHSYLVGQRLTPRNAPLPVHVAVDDKDFRRLRPALRDSDDLRFHHVPVTTLATRVGAADAPSGSNALPVLLTWMARGHRGPQLATAPDTRYFGIWKMRQAVVGAGLALCFACLLYAGKLWVDGDQMATEAAQLRASADARSGELARLEQALPALSVPLAELRPAIETLAQIETQRATPGPWLAHLSEALERHPDIRLEGVNWHHSDTDAAEAPIGEARLSLPASLATDRRAMLDAARAFLDDLSPGANARLVRPPVNLASDQTFRNDTQTPAPDRRPTFEVAFSLEAAR